MARVSAYLFSLTQDYPHEANRASHVTEWAAKFVAEVVLPFLRKTIVTKTQLMLTSLVAWIPAAFLAYLLIMVMLSHSENLSTMAYIVMGGTLVSAVVTVLIPVAVMVGGKRKPAPEKPVAKKPGTGDAETSGETVELHDDSVASFDAHDVLAESHEFDMGNSDMNMSSEDIEADIDTDAVEDFDDFDLEEEEEKPKPKKKKK